MTSTPRHPLALPLPLGRWLAWLTACLALATLLFAGCSKEEPVDPKKINLKGADKVIAALDKKEFVAAIAALAEARAGIASDKDATEYRKLREHCVEVLVPQMGNNDAARDAFQALSQMETGR